MSNVEEVKEALLHARQKVVEMTTLAIEGGTKAKEISQIINNVWGEGGATISTSFMSLLEKSLLADRDFNNIIPQMQAFMREIDDYIERL